MRIGLKAGKLHTIPVYLQCNMHHKVYVLLFYNLKNLFFMIFYCVVDDSFTLVDRYHADMMQIEINNVNFKEKIKVHVYIHTSNLR